MMPMPLIMPISGCSGSDVSVMEIVFVVCGVLYLFQLVAAIAYLINDMFSNNKNFLWFLIPFVAPVYLLIKKIFEE